MFTKLYRERLNALFADIELLAADPVSKSPAFHRELEGLRTRLAELEAQVQAHEECAYQPGTTIRYTGEQAAPRIAAPLYEKEKLGFVYEGDKLLPIQDPAAALSNPDHTLIAALTASGQPIGEMQIQSTHERSWTSEEAGLANAVAQQASLQIQNLRLLAATERARSEAEAATRRFIHQGWDSYLDAIHQNERVGFSFNQDSVAPYPEMLPTNSGVHLPMVVMDEQIGALYLKTDPHRPLTNEDRLLAAAVAGQIAQQVENLRLLADASRARAEAEETVRLMTRESWKIHAELDAGSTLGFIYDTNQVIPLRDAPAAPDLDFAEPLTVRGETIGRLGVAGGSELSPEAARLTAAIAGQVSIHLETLRLNEELRKRAAELQELDRLKSAFLANMSHELRTPLNSILGFADVVLEGLDGPLTPTMSNDLQLIQKNGQHLLHLINDVLDMAKIEAGRMNLSPEKFRVHEILEEVTSITSTLASERNLALYIEKDSDRQVEIFADRTRLRQVMLNLIHNSIKFTEIGRISIHAIQRNEHVLIKVSDTGIGIPVNKLDEVFQEFAQVDVSSTRKAGGTGLGLPISRRLVEMHGGRLWAESSGVPGQGSTFFVELPLEARMTESIEKQEK